MGMDGQNLCAIPHPPQTMVALYTICVLLITSGSPSRSATAPHVASEQQPTIPSQMNAVDTVRVVLQKKWVMG